MHQDPCYHLLQPSPVQSIKVHSRVGTAVARPLLSIWCYCVCLYIQVVYLYDRVHWVTHSGAKLFQGIFTHLVFSVARCAVRGLFDPFAKCGDYYNILLVVAAIANQVYVCTYVQTYTEISGHRCTFYIVVASFFLSGDLKLRPAVALDCATGQSPSSFGSRRYSAEPKNH